MKKKKELKTWCVIFVLFRVSTALFSQPGSFDFNDGTLQNWQIDQLYDTNTGNAITSSYTALPLMNDNNKLRVNGIATQSSMNSSITSADFFFESPDLSGNSNWQNITGYSVNISHNWTSKCGLPVGTYFYQVQIRLIDTSDGNKVKLFAEHDGTNYVFHSFDPGSYANTWEPSFLSDSKYKVKQVRIRICGLIHFTPAAGCDTRQYFTLDDVCPVKSSGTGNTPTGSNSVVVAADLTVSFDNVTTAGNTTLTRKTGGAAPPNGFSIVPSTPPSYYDIQTTASYTGNIQICIKYIDTGMTLSDEQALTLQVYEVPPGSWKDITQYVNTNTNTICGQVNHLTDFAVMAPTGTASSYRYNFTGHVYNGEMPETGSSLGSVPIELWGDDNDNPEDSPGTLIVSDTTNSFGDFYIHSESAVKLYDYYHVMRTCLPGYLPAGVEVQNPDGAVTNENCITYEGSGMTVGDTFEGNLFWDRPDEGGPDPGPDPGPESFGFQGHVFEGPEGDRNNPLMDVHLEIFGDDDQDPYNGLGDLIGGCVTDASGAFSLLGDGDYGFYHIVAHDMPDFQIVSAAANQPCHVFDDHVVNVSADDISPGSVYDEINYWYVRATSVGSASGGIPTDFNLSQNYPNPFNPSTHINYELPEKCRVTLTVYNIHGSLIRMLVDKTSEAGIYSVLWDGTDSRGNSVAAGAYLCRIKMSQYQKTIQMLLMK